MSRETERIFTELHKAMAEQNLQDGAETQEFINQFIQQYNENAGETRELDAYDYLELAQDSFDPKAVIRYAQKALKLDPYCLDAELMIAQAKADTLENLKKNIEKVILKGEEQLAQRNISKDTDAGSFYGILETRPYMRVRKEYLDLLITQGRYCHAIREAEEMLRLNENDNLGVRYLLMALYVHFEDADNAQALFEKYQEDTAFMLLPLIALMYKMENVKKMKSYVIKLKNRNPHLAEALEMLMDDDEKVDEISQATMYQPFSLEEVVLAFSEASFVYCSMNGFLDMLYDMAVS